jgi:UDP-GlcNAc:undecaprenyl-phosphate/decaprenyl-phosphate GlcNAc-1-phosphate transferase
MITSAISFALATAASAFLTPRLRDFANRQGWVDQVSSRKVHGIPIPRVGGIAIVGAFFVPLIALYFVHSDVGARFYANPRQALGFLAGGVVIAALGVVDDLKGARARTKFLVQLAVAAAMYGVGYRIDSIATPFGVELQLGWLALPFTMVWIAGVINAVNLIDGLDGLAGGIALIAIAGTCAMAGVSANPLMLLFAATLAGAVLGFLFYNFNPASIFMGDTGSMFLGFVLATTAIQTNQRSSTAVALVVPVVALGLPIVDTLLAMARRAARGVPLFSADRGHIHHRLLDLGLSHRQTVLVLYGVSALLGVVALAIAYSSTSVALWFLLALAAMAYAALRRLGYIDLQHAERLLEQRRRNVETRAAIRRVGSGLRSARSRAEVWAAIRIAARALGADGVSLRLGEAPDEETLSSGFAGADADRFRARFALGHIPVRDEYVELGWSDGRTSVDRDTEIAIELLCDQVSVALERLRAVEFGESFRAVRKVAGIRH